MAQGRHPLRLPPRRQEDPTVREANGDGRQEEGEHGRPQGEGEGDPQAALKRKPPRRRQLEVGVWVRGVSVGGEVAPAGGPRDRRLSAPVAPAVPLHLNGQEGGQRRQPPRSPHQEQRPRGGHPLLVAQRRDDEEVAVQADHAQVEDGRAAAHDVKAEPDGTEGGPQDPPPAQHVEHGRGHDHQRHHQVRQKQRDQEAVGGATQRSVRKHQNDEEHVAADRHQDDDGQHGDEPPGGAAGHVQDAGGERAVGASQRAKRGRVRHGRRWMSSEDGRSTHVLGLQNPQSLPVGGTLTSEAAHDPLNPPPVRVHWADLH